MSSILPVPLIKVSPVLLSISNFTEHFFSIFDFTFPDPSAQDNPGVEFVAFAGETLQVTARETAAATPVVNMFIEVVPL